MVLQCHAAAWMSNNCIKSIFAHTAPQYHLEQQLNAGTAFPRAVQIHFGADRALIFMESRSKTVKFKLCAAVHAGQAGGCYGV